MNNDTIRLQAILDYLQQAVDSFVGDPADSDFQRGYQAAVEEVLDFAEVK